ncbi:hypothetical protein [Pacificispira sp.]|uniref:hypothetical protein n=1 Tax=Pacificispira sp. TaxID=2888761 RepID=UPI003BADA2AB
MHNRLDAESFALNELLECLNYQPDLESAREAAENNLYATEFAFYDLDDIFSDYEQDHYSDADELTSGTEYKAGDWRSAREAYANALALSACRAELDDAVTTIKERLDDLTETVAEYTDQEPKPETGWGCTHGWAAHDLETDSGVCVWKSRQLDGVNGAAVQLGCGYWASVTWNPDA